MSTSAGIDTTTAYDRVPYPSHAHPQTFPDRLATLATLLGIDPPAVETCRVLELGCGEGGNLMPPALSMPSAQLAGIDLAAVAVERAQARAKALGLKNVSFRQMDLTRITPAFGQFDYIIAHGVYSWVPAEVRDKLLAVCKSNLAPTGVAYVSYNALPGCHIRQMARRMMLFHVRGIPEPAERVGQARGVLKFLAESESWPRSPTPAQREALAEQGADLYRALLHRELERVTKAGDGVFFHDDLADVNDPVYFHEFAAHAARHGLAYLSEADFFETQLEHFPPRVAETLSRVPAADVVAREQYADFVKCRAFRQTLLCHAEAPVDPLRAARPERVAKLYAASAAQPASQVDVRSAEPQVFRGPTGTTASTNRPLAKAALVLLAERWPEAVRFDELLAEAQSRTGVAGTGDHALELGETLLSLYSGNLVELRAHPPRVTSRPGDRPAASPLARLQAEEGPLVTTLLGTGIRVEGTLGRRLLRLLDGTRDRAAIIRDLAPLVQSGEVTMRDARGEPARDAAHAMGLLEAGLGDKLRELARLGLLVE